LFNDIKDGTLDIKATWKFLFNAKRVMHREWKDKTMPDEEKFYYKTRAEFNENPDSIRFLYLNLACYKNLMRFNSSGGFNAPYFYDPSRYLSNENDVRGNYIKIVLKRILRVRARSTKNDWTFIVTSFKDLLERAREGDLVYADPPYIGRDVNYFASFSREDNDYLVKWANITTSGFAISNWYSDAKGKNPWIAGYGGHVIKTRDHRYMIENCQTMKTSDTMVKECLIINKQAEVTVKYGLMKYIGDKQDAQRDI
jgi:DNA adenine methylase